MKHAEGQPVLLTDFIPATGGATTEVLITGDNFSSDTSDIKVTINGKVCTIIGANTKQIMVIVPKKCGSGSLVVTMGKDSVVSSAPFTYIFTTTVSTLAGGGTAGFADGQGADAMFSFNGQSWYRMMGIGTDDKGNVFVTDPGNACIRKIDSSGNASVLAGSPGNAGGSDGKGTEARFQIPYGLAVDAQGNVYTADPGTWSIRKITPDGTTTTLGGTAQEPWNVAVDKASGKIYYSSTGGGSVFEMKADGSSVAIVNGISAPGGLAFDNGGNMYVSSNTGHTIIRYKAGTWEPTIIAGATGVPGFVNGTGAAARFANPWGLAVDGDGTVYVAGNGSYGTNVDESIRAISPNTWDVITYAGNGVAGYSDGIGGLANFNAPMGVAVDKNGVVYVLDKNNNRVRKIVSE
ncbi:IPT/TIG domain-containing protein [Chitinophaga sp.]|uniref:IPT/TIG domain-containing protein n=1 Tax=Chitinophaga sp. TaxID=1869181 RepID=UPI002F955215